MAIFVYITGQCLDDAVRHNSKDDLLNLRDKIEQNQTLSHFNNFPPPYLKKRFQRQIRLISRYKDYRIGEETHTVVIFFRVFIRGGDEYSRFLRDPIGFGEKSLEPLIDDAAVEAEVAGRIAKEPLPVLDPPSEYEYKYLYQVGGKGGGAGSDLFVCESEAWVQKVHEDPGMKKELTHICAALVDNIESLSTDTVLPVGNRSIKILCRRYPQLNKVFLAGIFQNGEEEAQLRKEYAGVLAADESLSEKELLRCSVRTYPVLILVDEDQWLEVEQDRESNLALSPEEAEVLESVYPESMGNGGGFPLFINGRAGSGKSTILYYIFSDYLSLYLREAREGDRPPVLFTCNSDLLQKAKDTVTGLMRSSARHAEHNDREIKIPEESFQEFHGFLYGLYRKRVEAGKETRKLELEKRISHSIFRRMWQEKFGRTPAVSVLGADLSWHVIRTYIKGTNPTEFLEPDEYDMLPDKQKSVSREAYAEVFTKVWENWYQKICEKDAFWDDQDLARCLFEDNEARALFPAIVCDEAQDFTKVELELLFRFGLFSRRALDFDAIRRVPYIFAGDPFQTLNPTGFRWDAIKASFHEKFTDSMRAFDAQVRLHLNYRELNLNYRSTSNIVKMSNLIQALRAALFDLTELHPQKTWQHENRSPVPMWFDRSRIDDWKQLGEEKDIMIIVPCMLGEEKEFVENDSCLRGVVSCDDEGVPSNVFSAIRAKGLEFARVAVYGFGDFLHRNGDRLLELLDAENEKRADSDYLLYFEYFVNRLYVAVSRSKKRLFIIDSLEGRAALWNLATDDRLLNQLLRLLPEEGAEWQDQLGTFQQGVPGGWDEDRGDTAENAQRMKEQGLAMQDPFMLRSAANNYEYSGNKREAQICKAEALLLEKRYTESGAVFEAVSMAERALECYWHGKHWAELRKLSRRDPQLGIRLECRLAHSLEEFSFANVNAFMQELLRQLDAPGSRLRLRMQTEPGWKEGVNRLLAALLKRNSGTEDEWKLLSNLMLETAESGAAFDREATASIHYRAKNFEDALRLWEQAEQPPKSEEYRTAKRISLAARYMREPDREYEAPEYLLLVEHFSGSRDRETVYKILQQAESLDLYLQALPGVQADAAGWTTLFNGLFSLLIRSGEWEVLIEADKLSNNRSSPGSLLAPLKQVLQKNSGAAHAAFVKSCARMQQKPSSGQYFDAVSSCIERILDQPLEQWRRQITLFEAAGAMENYAKYSRILPFYEKLLESGLDENGLRLIRRRWLATKRKQAQRISEKQGASASIKYLRELTDRQKEWSILDEIADFPVPEDLNPAPAVPVEPATAATPEPQPRPVQPTPPAKSEPAVAEEFEAFGFKFHFFPDNRRLNITCKEDANSASILLDAAAGVHGSGFVMRSIDIEPEIRDDGTVIMNGWDLLWDAGAVQRERQLLLRKQGSSVEFRFCLQENME